LTTVTWFHIVFVVLVDVAFVQVQKPQAFQDLPSLVGAIKGQYLNDCQPV